MGHVLRLGVVIDGGPGPRYTCNAGGFRQVRGAECRLQSRELAVGRTDSREINCLHRRQHAAELLTLCTDCVVYILVWHDRLATAFSV